MAVRTSNGVAAGSPRREAWLGESEMASRVREFRWEDTPLGPIATWPPSLKSAVAICLHSPFQMAIYWGPELNCIYNDAERDALLNLHPGALGMPASELLHDSWEVVGPQLQAVIDRGEATWAQDRPLTFDRRGQLEVSYFTYSYSPILDDDGTVGGVLLITQDTTARVLAERRIDAIRELAEATIDAPTARRACELAASTLAGGPDVPFASIYLVDDAGQRATCIATSRAPDAGTDAQPTCLAVDLDVPSDQVSRLLRRLARIRSGGTRCPADLFVNGRGTSGLANEVFVAVIARGAADPLDGYLVAGLRDDVAFDQAYEHFLTTLAMGVGRSVAAARAREAEHQRAEEIAALDRAKTAFFGNASHELRAPLSLILGHLDQLLEEERPSAGLRETIEVARRSALRMLKLVNALLDFSRIEAGESIGVLQETDIATLTREIASMFESTAERAGLRLTVESPPPVAPVWVDCDAWECIVSNLISNALKFTPEGEVRVSTAVTDGQICLTVADTGVGIAPEDLDRVFSRFYRSSGPPVCGPEGSGIGLALVRQLAEFHGGSVEAESRPHQGTRVIVRMPAVREHPRNGTPERLTSRGNTHRPASLFVAEAEGWFDGAAGHRLPERRRPATRDGAAGEMVNLARRPRPLVVVAEDNADMREYLRRLLAADFSVTLAPDGDEAFELAVRDPPSIVLTDVMMPGLDGFALMRALRRDPRTRDVPVILLSARADPDSTVRALELGADDYIIKPFGGRELLARMRATLENSRARIDSATARGRTEERTRHQSELTVLLNDLRAAQQRVAAAGDAERRRIEQDLHDGAQQRLMAIRLELAMARELLEHDPDTAGARLDELHHELDETLEELRELAHGLYPALLASDGLYAAIQSAARHCAIPVAVEETNVARAPRSIENAAYFCCLEALQNAAKHAGPEASASIRVRMASGMLEWRVSDNGKGFDPTAVRPGYGIVNVRDRVEALGGHVEVISAPGRGTIVIGRMPMP